MKIYRFINELNIGDIIVTPGKDEILIGEIISEPYIVNCYNKIIEGNEVIGTLNKARNVKWIKRIKRIELEPNLKMILGVYHGIAHIKNGQVITEVNRAIYDFYIKDEKGHSIFRITEQKEIDFEKYAYFIKSINDVYQIFKDDFQDEKLSIKTNVQSPGPIEIIGGINIVKSVVLAISAILKHDNQALERISQDKQSEISAYMMSNPPEYDYDDYEFPSYGTY